MNIKIRDNGYEKQAAILKRCIDERIPTSYVDNGMEIELFVDEATRCR